MRDRRKSRIFICIPRGRVGLVHAYTHAPRANRVNMSSGLIGTQDVVLPVVTVEMLAVPDVGCCPCSSEPSTFRLKGNWLRSLGKSNLVFVESGNNARLPNSPLNQIVRTSTCIQS